MTIWDYVGEVKREKNIWGHEDQVQHLVDELLEKVTVTHVQWIKDRMLSTIKHWSKNYWYV